MRAQIVQFAARFLILFGVFLQAMPAQAFGEIDTAVAEVLPKVVSWRRDIHQHPELSNREFRTAALVEAHLRSLGMEVRTGIAHTGVVGVLRGGDGPTVALRADMDALPITEAVDLPFASKAVGQYKDEEVGVMHACGHDMHVAMLMGVAEILSQLGDKLPGTVLFVFQPAEEGPPRGEEGGSSQMLAEGVFNNPKPEAVFGLHVFPYPVGTIAARPGGLMASSDNLFITVHGKQTHGAEPWKGVDPVVAASQVVMGLQSITSRQLDPTLTPSVITIGTVNGGVRHNIVPDSVSMSGTIRTFDAETRTEIHRRVKATAESIAAASGARAEVRIDLGNPVTRNDPALFQAMLPTLERVTDGHVLRVNPVTTAEDFSEFARVVPGLFFFLGVGSDDPSLVHPNHSPKFYADERALPLGIHAMTALTLDYMRARGGVR